MLYAQYYKDEIGINNKINNNKKKIAKEVQANNQIKKSITYGYSQKDLSRLVQWSSFVKLKK